MMKIDKSVICCINVGFTGALNRSSKEQPTIKPARKHGAKEGGRDEWETSRSGGQADKNDRNILTSPLKLMVV